MKVRTTRWLSLAILPTALAAILASTPANAADYTGDCASVPSSVSGNINITESGACNISHNITATGYISVVSTGGSITAKNMNAAYHININTSSGSVDVEDLTANTADVVGNIRIEASGNVKTKNLSTAGSSGIGGVEVHANTDGTSSPFIIGGTGNSNGVNGTIDVTTASGGGTTTTWVNGGIYITNGDESSTGGITLTNMSDLQVSASASRSGLIFLDAMDGTITLPAGTMQTNGASGHGAGEIALLADTIAFGNDTTVSASQISSAYGTFHGVSIAAENINFGGTTKGLEILADGNGNSQYEKGYVYILPKGSITITDSGDFQSMAWYKSYPNFYYDSGEVNITGGTTSKLKVTANGDHTDVVISGYPVNFTGGEVKIQAIGNSDHNINIAYYGTTSSSQGLTFENSGIVEINANGDTGNGGNIQIYVDKATFDAASFLISADGTHTGDGNSGTVTIISTELSLDSAATAKISADGAPNGTGYSVYSEWDTWDPKAIQFYPGSINMQFGTDPGQFELSARGGATSGNAGAISTSATEMQLLTEGAISLNARGGNSNGGSLYAPVYITGVATGLIDATNPDAVIDATGKGSGEGGKVRTYAYSFDYNKFIKVDGGSSTTSTSFNGSLSMNSVTCQLWKTGYSYPSKYWNCSNPSAPADEDLIPATTANGLPNSIPSLVFDTVGTTLYVMNDTSQFGTFFGGYLDPATGGFTFAFHEKTRPLYTAIFRGATLPTLGTVTFSDNWLEEITTHEVGHSVDANYGVESGNSAFLDAFAYDLAVLDAAGSGNPCGTGAPFEGVVDLQTRQQFCTSGVLNNPNGLYFIPNTTTLMSNSQIARRSSQNLDTVTFLGVANAATEPYAQAFAYRGKSSAFSFPSGYFDPTVDGLMHQGYFQCVQAAAAARLGQSFTPAYSCP